MAGLLEVSSDHCAIDLSAVRWGTDGPVRCEAHEIPGRFVFPIRIGAGDAMAVADWRGDQVLIPMSSQEGWLELELSVSAGSVEVPPLQLDTKAWARGQFVVQGVDGPEGSIDLETGLIDLYSPRLLSDGPVAYSASELGPDLAIEVLVEPSLGDPAVFLLNRPTGEMILPGGPDPWTATLTPGVVEDRERLRARAIALADEAEAAQMKAAIDAVLATTEPPCVLPEEYAPFFRGYDTTLESSGSACVISIEPDPEQHRRRLRGRWPAE